MKPVLSVVNIPRRIYKQIVELMPIPCVDLLIYCNNSFLLLKRINEPAKGQWFVPGGRIQKNETISHAVHRKAVQELGMNVVIDRILGTYEVFFPTGPFGDSVHNVVIAVLAHFEGDIRIKLDDQHKSYKFISTLPSSAHPYLFQILHDAHMLGPRGSIHAPRTHKT